MEESGEMHSEENKALPEKNRKRKLKTPAQLDALESFYNEHKYPTEEMKQQLAESIGLTEKQVSGWFCHRRLKDKKSTPVEVSPTGKQDRSSVIIQDRGSGLRQDSCGSTKQGENRQCEPKEVESRRYSGQDFPVANPADEQGQHQDGNYSDMDDTSSGSSLPVQHKFHPRNEAPLDMATSRYLSQRESHGPTDSMGIKPRRGPSGYLKVKGQVENAAITAVKRQLGRHYQEDGPALGIEFDPLPPGAFESSNGEPDNGGPYKLGDSDLCCSPDVPNSDQLNTNIRYEVSQDSYMHVNSSKDVDGFGRRDKVLGNQSKTKYFPSSHGSFRSHNPVLGMGDNSGRKMSAYGDASLYDTRAENNTEGRIVDSVSSHHLPPYSRKGTIGQTDRWLSNSDMCPVSAQGEGLEYRYSDQKPNRGDSPHFESRHLNRSLKHGDSLGEEDRILSSRVTKEDISYGKRKGVNAYINSSSVISPPTNEIRVPKREKHQFLQHQPARKMLTAETSQWTNPINRSAAELPSSFSEDETAETSSSMD